MIEYLITIPRLYPVLTSVISQLVSLNKCVYSKFSDTFQEAFHTQITFRQSISMLIFSQTSRWKVSCWKNYCSNAQYRQYSRKHVYRAKCHDNWMTPYDCCPCFSPKKNLPLRTTAPSSSSTNLTVFGSFRRNDICERESKPAKARITERAWMRQKCSWRETTSLNAALTYKIYIQSRPVSWLFYLRKQINFFFVWDDCP